MSHADQAIAEYITLPFGNFARLFKLQAATKPEHIAVICEGRTISYSELDALADRVAAGLQRDGVKAENVVAICAKNSIEYAAILSVRYARVLRYRHLHPQQRPTNLLV